MVLHAGDLSYADCYQPRWDSYGRMCDPLSSQVAWMTVGGNHEIEDPGVCGASLKTTFVAYNSRYGSLMPHAESASPSTQFYSFELAGVHILMLGSYVMDEVPDVDAMAAQLKWLKADLATVDRSRTPWLVGVLHAPWYNSNFVHQHEKEEYELLKAMEQMLYDARLDVMFAGHVHAYERSHRVFQSKTDKCAPVYVNIGDGGNREGLARHWQLVQPSWSAYREAAFGHGILSIQNHTHVKWTWHRDENAERVVSDEVWLAKDPSCATAPLPAAASDELVVESAP
uniref:Acid phosphatase n=1 Tax=Haptolina brevifila TaxID=156173 RepID=A0A7S2DQR4_9EUKA|mmetsp:Transcript_42497/g.85211  ORF Transcript_42497/g.85211 Transcript_42497/m.85211 type:complete len:285 (+) Transcript_42497:913-1767(+)